MPSCWKRWIAFQRSHPCTNRITCRVFTHLQRRFPPCHNLSAFTLPEVEYTFALPQNLAEQGLRRYGFHGLSYQYVIRYLARLTPRADGRVVMAHLGSGASLCATYRCQSQATTMGFSALDGLMMGTRCGALDAGVLLHLLGQGWDRARLEDLLYRRSGLLGVSGISADMRQRCGTACRCLPAIGLYGYQPGRRAQCTGRNRGRNKAACGWQRRRSLDGSYG